MTSRWRGTLGVAIGRDRMVARALGARGAGDPFVWTRELSGGDAGWREALRDAFSALRTDAPAADTVHIALIPPLADARLAELPAAAGPALRPALVRDASKYFPVGNERQVVQVHMVGTAAGNGLAAHVICAASERVVDDVLAAAGAAGLTVLSLAPAQSAWTKAARRAARGNAEDAPLPANNTDEAFELAARFAAQPDARSLWPARVYAERDRRAWKRAASYGAAAAFLLFAAAGIEWTATGRELARLADERAALRPQVTAALQARDSLQGLGRRLSMLRSFGADAWRWTHVIDAVATVLPDDASLISLGVYGDTLIVIGEAEQSAPVFAAMGQSNAFTRVRAHAPIQQQVEDGEVIVERFTIAAQLTAAGRQ